jgi:hypothetical protein
MRKVRRSSTPPLGHAGGIHRLSVRVDLGDAQSPALGVAREVIGLSTMVPVGPSLNEDGA